MLLSLEMWRPERILINQDEHGWYCLDSETELLNKYKWVITLKWVMHEVA